MREKRDYTRQSNGHRGINQQSHGLVITYHLASVQGRVDCRHNIGATLHVPRMVASRMFRVTSVDTSNPAICGQFETGHFPRGGPRQIKVGSWVSLNRLSASLLASSESR